MSSDAFDLSVFLKTLPNLPGVYRMLDKCGQVLYVGKAVNLKKRVNSYFVGKNHSPRISLMIKQIHRIETTVTRSEAEALILENNLIKSLSPKYNILFRDDKSYPYLKFSAHSFPQIRYYRGKLQPPHRYFGPFPHSQAVKETIETLQKVFRLRSCEDNVFHHRSRPCLLYQIRRCSGACCGLISEEDYALDIRQAADFLDGKTDDLLHTLTAEMNAASQALNFEKAAILRDKIQALNAVQSRQFIDSQDNINAQKIDIIAPVCADGLLCIHCVAIRFGRRILDHSFFPNIQIDNEDNRIVDKIQNETRHKDAGSINNTTRRDNAVSFADFIDIQAAFEAFVSQRYIGKEKPNIIITAFRLPENLHNLLEEENQHKITIVNHPKGERRVWLNMAENNARLSIAQKSQQTTQQQQRRLALEELMGISPISRIECFDISHSFGESTVASCVVYDDNAMQPSQYRRFNIQSTSTGDDYAAMKEALTRRYTKLAQQADDAPPKPDLVIIDGGKGQLTIALEVWADLGLNLPLIGIAKGPERKDGAEDLIIPATGEVLNPPPTHLARLILQMVRDEAHRFAITGHRKRRDKSRTHNALDDIDGIGAKRKKALITRFGSVKAIQSAAVEEIAQVTGISLPLAEKIYAYFHSE
ncbi:MAG: excinuclease ABC subunit UvrC [Neisseriaceae bacterium]|nr:excinuclease ABC subunit UvrC [Neisseriaceae bacterium]